MQQARRGREGHVERVLPGVEAVHGVVEPSLHAQRQQSEAQVDAVALAQRVVDFFLQAAVCIEQRVGPHLVALVGDAFGQILRVQRGTVLHVGAVVGLALGRGLPVQLQADVHRPVQQLFVNLLVHFI